MGNHQTRAQRAAAKGYEAILASAGMPAELPPCAETSLDEQYDKAYAEEMTPFNLLADLLAEHDMRPEDLLTAPRGPASLHRRQPPGHVRELTQPGAPQAPCTFAL
jgi:hypothetical protein